MMGWVGGMIEKFPVIGWILGALATGFIISATAIGAATAAQWLWNAALVANPIGLIIAGIALVVGGAYALYKNWGKVTDWFNQQLAKIGQRFSWIGGLWRSLFGGDDEEQNMTVTTTHKEHPPDNTKEGQERPADQDVTAKAATPKPKPKPGFKPVALATTVAAMPLAAQPVDVPLPAVATPQARQVQHADNRQHHDHSTHSYQLTIQQPGEDAQALTERILAELEQRRQQSQREGLHDGL